MTTYDEFFTQVCQGLSIVPTPNVLNAFYAVSTLEGANDRWNPLNSVVPYGDSTAFNSVGVQDYKSEANGVAGTVALLQGSHWYNVVTAMRTQQTTDDILSAFKSAYTWDPNVNFPRNDTLGTVNMPGSTQPEPTPEPTPSGNTYTVEPGDSLWDIAARVYGDGSRYGVIATANGITSPYIIRPGEVLTIPRPGASPVVPPHAPVAAGTYTVREGDNLWNIAGNELGDHSRWVQIAALNGIGAPYIIHPGQVLRMP